MKLLILSIYVVLSTFHTCTADDDYVVTNRSFPKDFKFGLATAAFQIEGAWDEDGKGPSVWDHECHTHPEKFSNQVCADVASDSYHKYKEDVQDMVWLGAQTYRFSISWPRILPTGDPDNVNEKGIQYYKNLIAELKEANIEPFPTMFHYDTPQALQDMGGWANDSIVDLFAGYARVLFKEFGDDVKRWVTINEPQHVCYCYGDGGGPPNEGQSGVTDYICAHNIIKAHAKVYHLYQDEFKATQNGQISLVTDANWGEPASNSSEDVEAAERAMLFGYGWFAHPLVYGNYPQVMIDRVKYRSEKQGYNVSRLPEFSEEEQEYNKGTLDYLCINTYTTSLIKNVEEDDFANINRGSDVKVSAYQSGDWESTVAGWFKVVPWGLRKLTTWVSKTYNNPEIIITENGYVDGTGTLNDTDTRARYHKLYLSNLQAAMYEDGANVTGYMAWSLMDNYEWYTALTRKLGLFHVDFDSENKTRTPKESAYYYKHICTTKCLVDTCVD